MMTTPDLCPGYVKINVAEFLALLITRETFTPFCEGKITSLWVYNVSARAWFDSPVTLSTAAPKDFNYGC